MNTRSGTRYEVRGSELIVKFSIDGFSESMVRALIEECEWSWEQVSRFKYIRR